MSAIAFKIILIIFLIFSSLILNFGFAYSSTITDIRFWSAPDHTRIVLDITKPIKFETISQEDKLQLHLLLKDADISTTKREIEINDPFISKISIIEIKREKDIKLIIQQKRQLQANIFLLKPYLQKPHRLVIDLVDIHQEQEEVKERQRQREIQPKGTKIVVIDPGHGGEDPGAIGPRKTMEKDIVLKVGEKIIKLFNNQSDIKAFLTRKGDYFIPLEGRVKIAREYKADLFVSLHTDGSFNPRARGSSVYCLSLTGATDEAAKILANRENMSNILGGAFLRPVSLSKDPNLNQILLDLMQNNSMKESFRFAELALDEIKKINQLKYQTYRQANFIVLRAPDIPSVLIEMAYITNKEDEKLLNKNDFQEKIATSIVNSIKKFFNP